ncbi:FAD:protein FMN transferase [Sporolactobacillus sp. THM7-7]|nr:FAD:protein FMN transferase [Sporolactobacillus sp. THM7-7]
MVYQETFIAMDTTIMMTVVSDAAERTIDRSVRRAARCFYQIEQVCSRFDTDSELMRASRRTGVPVRVSPILYHAMKFAVEAAAETGGALDPTIGRKMELRGFRRNYLSGKPVCSAFAENAGVTFRDLVLNDEKMEMTLKKPMVLDLNAVAKGLAVDQAAKILRNAGFLHFMINAGGDIYAAGQNERHESWTIGIRDPLDPEKLAGTVRLSDAAICTSGHYERPSPVMPGESHLLDPRSGRSPGMIVSCSVIAPFAMLADAFSTAALVMGPETGIEKLEYMCLDGLMIGCTSRRLFTKNFKEHTLWNEQRQASSAGAGIVTARKQGKGGRQQRVRRSSR